jgi:hypothetical protein
VLGRHPRFHPAIMPRCVSIGCTRSSQLPLIASTIRE